MGQSSKQVYIKKSIQTIKDSQKSRGIVKIGVSSAN